MRVPARCLHLVVLITLFVSGSLHSQSAGEVLQRMLDTHLRQSANVENYTVVQEVMGFETQLYFEKELVNDQPTFRLRQSRVGGRIISQPEDDAAGWERLYQLIPELTRRAEYVGRSETHGFPVHVIEVRGLQELEFSPIPDSDEADFVPEKMLLHVDADRWIVRWAELTGTVTTRGGQHDFTATTDLTDYRDIEGLVHPFLITVRVIGLAEAMGVADTDMAQLRAQIEEMKKQMEQMPEAQRRMMEQMLEQRLAGFEDMLEGGGEGAMTVEIRVKELRVNSGPLGGA